eukprot:SAG31_NODE_14396_length_809_cov_1.371831_1_plen_25_part_10
MLLDFMDITICTIFNAVLSTNLAIV